MKEVIATATLIGGIVALIYFGPNLREHFGTRYADADREVFENSKPYIHGTIENLVRLKLEYETADNDSHRKAIKNLVLVQMANIDRNQVPYNINTWVDSL